MPADPYKQTEVERYLLQPAASWLERAVGAVAAMFGMALLSALCFFVYALLTRSDAKSTAAVYIAIFILAVLTAFLLNAGIRLLFSLPNVYGGLFPPAVWFSISVVMLLLSGFIVANITMAKFSEDGYALVCALLFALLSFGAGSHFRRKGRARSAA